MKRAVKIAEVIKSADCYDMVIDEIYELAVDNYYHDVEAYTERFKSGDIPEWRYRNLVEYAREFWLSANK